jgi:hypothetical protein
LARIRVALNFEGGETFDRRSEGFHAGKVYGIFSLGMPTADSGQVFVVCRSPRVFFATSAI